MRHEARVSLVRRSGADAVYLGQNLWLEVHKRHRGFAHLFGRDHITGHEVQNCVERSLPRLASFGLCFLRLVERSSHRLCQAVSDTLHDSVAVSLGQSPCDEVNFVDELRSEFNPIGETARYAVAPGFQLVVVV